MSALSEEFQEARRLLNEAAKRESYNMDERRLMATLALGHAILATALPATGYDARNDETLASHATAQN